MVRAGSSVGGSAPRFQVERDWFCLFLGHQLDHFFNFDDFGDDDGLAFFGDDFSDDNGLYNFDLPGAGTQQATAPKPPASQTEQLRFWIS